MRQTKFQLGYVCVCGGFNPLAMGSDGKTLLYVEHARKMRASGLPFRLCSLPVFPDMRDPAQRGKVQDLIGGIKEQDFDVATILMLPGNIDPLDVQGDEGACVEALAAGIRFSLELGAVECSGTTFEPWRKYVGRRLEGAAFDAAVERVAGIHAKAFDQAVPSRETPLGYSAEPLGENEMGTFTDGAVALKVARAINARSKGTVIARIIDDTAHAERSGGPLGDARVWREQAIAAGMYGPIHISKARSRGRIACSGPFILAAMRQIHQLGGFANSNVYVEVFDQDDEFLRKELPEFGERTFNGRSVIDVLVEGAQFTLDALASLDMSI